jgi:hypothetical protein
MNDAFSLVMVFRGLCGQSDSISGKMKAKTKNQITYPQNPQRCADEGIIVQEIIESKRKVRNLYKFQTIKKL